MFPYKNNKLFKPEERSTGVTSNTNNTSNTSNLTLLYNWILFLHNPAVISNLG